MSVAEIIGIALFVLGLAILLFTVLNLRKPDREHSNLHLADRAMYKMCFKTVLVNLDDGTCILDAKIEDTEPDDSQDYEKFIAEELRHIREPEDNADFFVKFSLEELKRAAERGYDSVEGAYGYIDNKGFAHRVIITAYFNSKNGSNKKGKKNRRKADNRALITFREDTPSAEEIALNKRYEHQTKQLEELQKEALAITDLLEEKYREVNKLEDTLSLVIGEKELALAEAEAITQEAGRIVAQKNAQIDALAGVGNGQEIEICDIRITIKDILPRIREVAEDAEIDFSLKVEDVLMPMVECDPDYVNAMIFSMVYNAALHCEKGEKIIFCISQVGAIAGYGEYEYSCVYLGNGLSFDNEIVDALGGRINIERTEDGATVVSVVLRFKMAETEESKPTLTEDERGQ